MKLKSLRLGMQNIARTTNTKTLSANSVADIYQKKEDGTKSDTLQGYSINCSTCKGDNINIKFDLSVSDKIAQLKKELENDVNVEISFTDLKLTPFALKTGDGSILSGVSAKASSFNIERIDKDDYSDLQIDLD